MEEAVYYIGQGDPQDKHSQESYGFISLIHGSQQYQSFRQADCGLNGSVITGIGSGERVFTASNNKALINVYSFGKEGIDQRMPVPEQINCLALLKTSTLTQASKPLVNVPNYKVPWLLVGGSKTGKIYIWELLSGELIFAKDIHYQSITKILFSKCGTFLITASEDSRCLVFKTLDLISVFSKDYDANPKPYWSINDHTLPITDFVVSDGIVNDINLYTVSKDATIRVYNIVTKQLVHTFVLPSSIECITKDPSNRNVYVGLTNGQIRIIPMFKVNNMNLQRVGNFGEIITVPNDTELKSTLTVHETPVTQLKMSMDGMVLISGDQTGNIYVSDINSKQITKSFKVNGPVSSLDVVQFPTSAINNDLMIDKKTRLLPPLKRVIADLNQINHSIYLELPTKQSTTPQSFDQWLDEKAQDELEFSVSPAKESDKLDKLSLAYADLKSKYDELLQEFNK